MCLMWPPNSDHNFGQAPPSTESIAALAVAKEVEARQGQRLVGLVSFQWPVTTPRRTWRRADVVAQRPSALFHFIPAPQA